LKGRGPSKLRKSFVVLFFLCCFSFALTRAAFTLPKSDFELAFPGTEAIVNYKKYGVFVNSGTEKYAYKILDKEGLKKAAGEGIYPNTSIFSDPIFRKFKTDRKNKINPWDYVDSGSAQNDFYAWAQASEFDKGVKLFYVGEALRKAGLIKEALKAYYAVVVHFPRSVIWAQDGSFYWYVAPEAIARIRKICATYPELGIQLQGALAEVEKNPKNNPKLDKVRTWPGKFVSANWSRKNTGPSEVTKTSSGKKVKVVKYDNRFWKLLVDGKPFVVKGVTYSCTTVGESPHAFTLRPWMRLDDNRNGKNDGMFDSWVDQNKNNRKDRSESVIGDAVLLENMGANAIRVYHNVDERGNYNPGEYDKELMRTLNKEHGIYFIMGDFLGAYTVGSNANWEAGTDYTDSGQREQMLGVLKDMVMDHKDEPYVLMWLLGNENQHPHTHTNANEHPKEYAEFVNEAAKMIHALDPDHPVAVCNLNASGLMELAKYAPDVDIYGANVYSGAYSMGSVWHLVKFYYDKPLLFTEMGCDAYRKDRGVDEDAQAKYLIANWKDIKLNMAGSLGEGNAIGGVVFEWMDEWWKSSKGNSWGDPDDHNTQADVPSGMPDSWIHEEWLGIFGQGNGSQSHFLREPRKVYEAIRKAWAGD